MLTGLKENGSHVRIGVFADCQYCDCETKGSRFYRNSTDKLEKCIEHFNSVNNIDFIVNLGDLIDRDFESYIPVKNILQRSVNDIINLPGNHDLEVQNEYLSKVPQELGLSEMYHSYVSNGWMFIFTDGNDLSFKSEDPEKIKKAEELTSVLEKEGKPNYYEWNGGIGEKQLKWMEKQLKKAERKNLRAAVFCHYPLLPLGAHSLWNYEEVMKLIEKYDCVKLWMNGHNHAGGYAIHDGIHFVTLNGMVETEDQNAFAEVTFSDNIIEIFGFGRVESRKLAIK